MPSAGELIVVCQCHRSCPYVEVASLYGVLPQVQFLDKVVDMSVAIGKPVEIPQVQFFFFGQGLHPRRYGVRCRWPDSAEPVEIHRCSSWTSCPRPLLVRGAHGQTVQKTVVMPQLQCRSWRLVPQIMGKSWKLSNFCDVVQIVASRAADHGDE